MSKHIKVRWRGLRERRRWMIWKVRHALGMEPNTLTEARKLWQERKQRLTREEIGELRKRYEAERAP